MKIMAKLNLLSIGIVLGMTVSVLGVGTLIINDILYKSAEQVLRLELSNASKTILQRLNRSGARAAAETAAEMQHLLQQKKGLKTAQLSVIESPDNRVVYHAELSAGDRASFDFIDQMVRREDGTIDYEDKQVARYAVFTTVAPINWLFELSISKQEMLEQRADFLLAIGIVTFAILALNALVIRLFGQRLLRRIGGAQDCVKRIEQGEFAARIPLDASVDEIAQLQHGINVMSAKIQQRTIEQQQAEQARRNGEARVRRLVDSNIIGIFFWRLDGVITEANDAFLQLVGFNREELLSGKISWMQLTPPEWAAVDNKAIEEIQATGTCRPYEKEYIRKDGSRVPILVGAALLEQSLDRGVAFMLDQSDRKRAETERQARLAAESANRAKSDFLSAMSHELRTPLNAVLGYAQILKRDPSLSERQIGGLNTIEQSGQHLLILINDLLDLAKIEAGKTDLYLESMNLGAFLAAVADIIRVRAEQKGLLFVCDLALDLSRTVQADEKRLRQVLLNLLSNAVKFTDQGQVSLCVQVLAGDEHSARLRFEVADTGVGMSPDQLGAIFEPFEQVGDMRQRIGGTGLGLSISQRFARLMGSEIHVESRLGEGSTFWFELDLPVIDSKAEPARALAVTGYEGPRKKILVVDDVAENRAMAVEMLRQTGFQMSEAINGEDALEKAQSMQPDLILMDLVMPGLDGLEATRRLRRLPASKDVSIIVLSASASAGDRQASLQAGANAFAPKPVERGRLLAQIDNLLHLGLIYEATPTRSAAPEREVGQLIAPPEDDMRDLYRLAQIGNMQDILQWASHVDDLDARYRPFAEQLRGLANGYQSKAILNLAKCYLDSKDVI